MSLAEEKNSRLPFSVVVFSIFGTPLVLRYLTFLYSNVSQEPSVSHESYKKNAYDLGVSCVEVLGIDHDSHRTMAEMSMNYPETNCEKMILTRSSKAGTWRRATWAKLDVLHENRKLLEKYDFIVVRDIDTKVNVSHLLRILPKKGKKQFVIGYTQKNKNENCDCVMAVTNWYAYWNGNRFVNAWRKSRRMQSDQYILNFKFIPCCRPDVLCVDKCLSGLNEVHCRRQQPIQKVHYGNQTECILNQKEPNYTFYDSQANYQCEAEVGFFYGL